jgi:hypothetical protein
VIIQNIQFHGIQNALVTNYETTNSGEHVIDALIEANTEVIKTGNGTPDIGVGRWTQNPGDSSYPDFMVVGGYFIDVFVNNITGVDQIEIRFHYTDDDVIGLEEQTLRMKWWDGTSWINCSDSGVNTIENFVWVKIRSDTSPNLSQMTGTPFSASGQRVVIPGLSWWGTMVLCLIFLAGIGWAARRRNLMPGTYHRN